jgi:hypothetical protein
MGVADLDPPKAPAQRCTHLCSRGCRIYEARPATCRGFECLWLQGALPREWRPDKVGFVGITDDSGERLVLMCDADRPRLWERQAKRLQALASKGAEIAVATTGQQPHTRFTHEGRLTRPEGV